MLYSRYLPSMLLQPSSEEEISEFIRAVARKYDVILAASSYFMV